MIVEIFLLGLHTMESIVMLAIVSEPNTKLLIRRGTVPLRRQCIVQRDNCPSVVNFKHFLRNEIFFSNRERCFASVDAIFHRA